MPAHSHPDEDQAPATVEKRHPASKPGPMAGTNFIKVIIEEDVRAGRHNGQVVTRFPPEPNGYLHIGHAKSICLNFGVAADFEGVCHLRFDDTNPETEDQEYVEAIKRDVRWLGFDWGENEYYASDYAEKLYGFAVALIEAGKAYVDSLDEEQIRLYRGTVTEPGRESPYRNRSVEENLDLFARMRAGEFPDGAHVLRARIDMASPNMLLRDPVLYRIKHAEHYRTGNAWCIYPLYDFAHPLSDAIEGITHSICTLEFEVHRPLYDWVVEQTHRPPRPHQYEFARLNLDYTVMSKRKLKQLVAEGHVAGWDDPRMPTISGLRRRGVTPEAIRAFCDRIGVTKVDSRVDIGMFEYSIRDDLNHRAPRVMCVLNPLKVVITNFPEGEVQWLDASYWPHDVPRVGSRKVPFSRELYIERDDFMEDPPRKYYRLAPGREVRLRYAYIIRCEEVVRDVSGEVVELRCTYDPETRSGGAHSHRKVKGTLHWVSASHAVKAEVRLYDRLFTVPDPEAGEEDFKAHLNPASCVVLADCRAEPSIVDDPPETRYQFERQGYFWRDPVDATPDRPVFNRIVTLRDSWAKVAAEVGVKTPVFPAEPPAPTGTGDPFRSVERRPGEALSPKEKIRYDRYRNQLGIADEDADQLARSESEAVFFEAALAVHGNAKSLSNWIIHVLRSERREDGSMPVAPEELAALVKLIDEGTVSGRMAKEVLAEMIHTGTAPADIVAAKGLGQISDPEELTAMIRTLLERHPDKVAGYRSGKTGLLGFFVGQVMRETGGKANPELAKDLLETFLNDR